MELLNSTRQTPRLSQLEFTFVMKCTFQADSRPVLGAVVTVHGVKELTPESNSMLPAFPENVLLWKKCQLNETF